ncbi:JmjC domain-containing histone demethylation protein 1 [Tilletia horrida]|nr:JmjC domain-containing histone demethylation protein 1 [Tilletia horrida]
MPIFVPGPCVGNCGATLTTIGSAKNHWDRIHKQRHPYDSRQGQRSLQPLVKRWSALSSTLHTYQKGIDALRLAYKFKLHKSTPPLISTSLSDCFNVTPTWYHIVRDLVHPGNASTGVISSVHSTIADDASPADVTASLLCSTLGSITPSIATQMTAALDVKLLATDGLKSCKYIPDAINTSHGLPSGSRTPDFGIAITPAGHLTEIHQDGVLDGSIITQIQGEKVFLMWPPTEHNLKITSAFHRGARSWLLHAIKHLELGQMLHLKPGCKFFLPAGTFHAVFSLTSSCLVGYQVHNPSMLDNATRLLTWDIDATIKLHQDADLLEEVIEETDILISRWEHERANIFQARHDDINKLIALWHQDLRIKLQINIANLRRPIKRTRR